MDSTVDPAADGIWDSVAVISTTKGTEKRQPRTPEEWMAVRRHAITLIESMNLVVLAGRHAAPAGTKPGLGELEPSQIERGIAEKHALFVSFAKALQGTALQALDAIDRKDTDAVVKTGGEIDASCEVCHVTFWYPNQH
jgi:cytochrome c556